MIEVMDRMQIQKEKVSRELWLGYFNQVLRQKGFITEGDYLKTARKIYTNKKMD